MSAMELSRLRARMDTLEATMERMVSVLSRIEGMYDTLQTRHEAMMQEKSDTIRSGMHAEIRANMSVLHRELLVEVKKQIKLTGQQ